MKNVGKKIVYSPQSEPFRNAGLGPAELSSEYLSHCPSLHPQGTSTMSHDSHMTQHTLEVDEGDEDVDDNEGASSSDACRAVDYNWSTILCLFLCCLFQTHILKDIHTHTPMKREREKDDDEAVEQK